MSASQFFRVLAQPHYISASSAEKGLEKRPPPPNQTKPNQPPAQTDDFKVRQQQALAAWVSKQRTYCEGLLTPRATEGALALLRRLPGPEKTELVELLRQLHAVVRPER